MNFSLTSEHFSRENFLTVLAKEAYRYGDFTLASGRKSKHYVNCKPVSLSGQGLAVLGRLLLEKIDSDAVSIAGLTLGADPLVSAVAMEAAQSGRLLNALIVRKEAKGYGTRSFLEGPFPGPGSTITVLEDVVTTGGSSLKVVNLLREAGFSIKRVVAIVDREEGGGIAMKQAGIELISLYTLEEIAKKAKELDQ